MQTAKLFQNGESQVVRLPKEISVKDPWDSFFKSIPQFSSDFMDDRNQATQQTNRKS